MRPTRTYLNSLFSIIFRVNSSLFSRALHENQSKTHKHHERHPIAAFHYAALWHFKFKKKKKTPTKHCADVKFVTQLFRT